MDKEKIIKQLDQIRKNGGVYEGQLASIIQQLLNGPAPTEPPAPTTPPALPPTP